MADQRIECRPSLCGKYGRDGHIIRRIGAKPVNGLRREGHELAGPQQLGAPADFVFADGHGPFWQLLLTRASRAPNDLGSAANRIPFRRLNRLGVKERWEAGPPRCLLRRVGLVPTSVNFEGLTEWVWRPPAGGQKAEARQRSHRHPYLPRCLGDPGTDGSCSTFAMKRSSG